MKRVLVIGSNGQLGNDIISNAPTNFEIVAHTRSDCDITEKERTVEFIDSIRPELIINTAAFHNTDNCEEDPMLSFEVNASAVKDLSEYCEERGIILAHISTDYVFGGKDTGQPYTENSVPSPINTYGISKFAGENMLQNYCESHFLFRISSVFGKAGASGKGTNFVYTMLNLSEKLEELKVIDDIMMTPTYTVDASRKIWEILESGAEFGTYHVSNSGMCTWYEFAKRIFSSAGIEQRVLPVTHQEYPTKAKRPLWSPLSSEKGAHTRSWEEGIDEFVNSIL